MSKMTRKNFDLLKAIAATNEMPTCTDEQIAEMSPYHRERCLRPDGTSKTWDHQMSKRQGMWLWKFGMVDLLNVHRDLAFGRITQKGQEFLRAHGSK